MHSKISLIAFLLCSCLRTAFAQSEQDALITDSVSCDSVMLDSTEMQLPWDERVKLELSRFSAEAEHSYFHSAICVWDLTADSLLFGYNNQKVMRPASTQKVITAISALDILGAKHEFRTRAYYTGEITADSTLFGDIYVVGDFDPLYSYGDLRQLARTVRDLGINRIAGTIYGDASMKSKDLYGNGWCWDDVPSKYEPALCPLAFNRGTLAPESDKYSKDIMFNPAEHFVKVLSDELSELGITPADTTATSIPFALATLPSGSAAKGKTPAVPSPKCFYTEAKTIQQVMQRMLKNSDNLHAEAVFFQIAHFNTGRNCTWKDGARQIENVLRKAGVNTSYVEIADGSGVSLYNYISANAQVAMLRYAQQHKNIYEYFYPALPIAGQDGTLSSRMKSGPAHLNAHAKTGTVEGVISLCGYVTASNGHLLAFSIINNGVLKGETARNFQDRICQELAR